MLGYLHPETTTVSEERPLLHNAGHVISGARVWPVASREARLQSARSHLCFRRPTRVDRPVTVGSQTCQTCCKRRSARLSTLIHDGPNADSPSQKRPKAAVRITSICAPDKTCRSRLRFNATLQSRSRLASVSGASTAEDDVRDHER
jgi:hypothetical protein